MPKSRYGVEDEYLLELGFALYCFIRIEVMAKQTVYCISKEGFEAINDDDSSGDIANKLLDKLSETDFKFNISDKDLLNEIAIEFKALTLQRNNLIHTHAVTHDDKQILHRLVRSSNKKNPRVPDVVKVWTLDEVRAVAKDFEKLALNFSKFYTRVFKPSNKHKSLYPG